MSDFPQEQEGPVASVRLADRADIIDFQLSITQAGSGMIETVRSGKKIGQKIAPFSSLAFEQI